ncbi:hypothetical protein [Senegalia sp. (in: firmicutes)]|uniref:hypothetical protein n=1 Tax=Senegalia sp. (in: firmicutes) TaxID=1924098 RepID=UPI003F9C565F
MEKEVYTLLDLAEEFGEDKQFIRRRLSKLNLRAINKDSREHINEPLEYNHDTYLKLADELRVRVVKNNDKNGTRNDTQSNTHETRNDTHKKHDDKDKLIEVLERELEHSKDKLKKSEEEKKTLMVLLDQQQRLSLQANQKIETLEQKEELEEEKNNRKEKKKWWNFF